MTARNCKKCGELFDARFCPGCKKAIASAYYEKNKAARNASSNAWRKANPGAVLEIRRRGYEKHRERRIADTNAWRVGNKYRISAYGRSYRADNKQDIQARNRAWHAANPDARRTHEHNRRARSRGRLSANLASVLFARQRGKCACCRKPLGKDYHLDHIQPLALGGRNEDSNMQLLRAKCNLQKRSKHPVDFMRERGFLL